MGGSRVPHVGWYTFVHDFVDGGIHTVAEELAETSARHVNLALVYHTARDVLPRNPRRRLRFMSGGTHYFAPDLSLYSADVTPVVDQEIAESSPVRSIRSSVRAVGMQFNAWVVFLHNSRAAMANPALAQRNVFGDPMLTDLCPSNPAVQQYAVALATDTARQQPDALLAESLHFHGLRHGYHHERYLFELGELAELAMSLCFCGHCVARALDAGVRVDAVARWAHDTATAAFAGRPQRSDGELTLAAVSPLADGELGRYIDVRCATVEALVARVREPLAVAGVPLVVLDPSGAVKGWADGTPTGAPVVETGWQFGLRVNRVAHISDGVEVLAYTNDVDRLGSDLAGYRSAVGEDGVLRASLRPAAPDTDSAEHLRRKMDAAAASGVTAIDLYHYGLLTPTATALVAQALSSPPTPDHSRQRGPEVVA